MVPQDRLTQCVITQVRAHIHKFAKGLFNERGAGQCINNDLLVFWTYLHVDHDEILSCMLFRRYNFWASNEQTFSIKPLKHRQYFYFLD